MPRKYQRVTDEIFESVDVREKAFDRVFYEEVRWWGSRFTDCSWTDCKFRRTSFAEDTVFARCKFQSCRFWAQHTYLGGPSRFEDCQFIDCSFNDVQLWEADFVRCIFTGSFNNLVFYGPEELTPDGWQTILENVDLSGVNMELTDFRCGIDLSTTKMPE